MYSFSEWFKAAQAVRMPIPLEAAVKNFWKLQFVDRVLTILWTG